MKGALVGAAAVLLGSAHAEVHKMKLKKIPLSEQLKSIPMETQLQGLGQKYMGARPESHADAIFRDTSMHVEGGHPLPITNFMNAQCTYLSCRLSVFSPVVHPVFPSHLLHLIPSR